MYQEKSSLMTRPEAEAGAREWARDLVEETELEGEVTEKTAEMILKAEIMNVRDLLQKLHIEEGGVITPQETSFLEEPTKAEARKVIKAYQEARKKSCVDDSANLDVTIASLKMSLGPERNS